MKEKQQQAKRLNTYYISWKRVLEREEYLEFPSKANWIRSQLRSGTYDLRIESGRFTNLQREDRLCLCCDEKVLEDEAHFLSACKAFEAQRKQLQMKIEMILQDEPRMLARWLGDRKLRERVIMGSWKGFLRNKKTSVGLLRSVNSATCTFLSDLHRARERLLDGIGGKDTEKRAKKKKEAEEKRVEKQKQKEVKDKQVKEKEKKKEQKRKQKTAEKEKLVLERAEEKRTKEKASDKRWYESKKGQRTRMHINHYVKTYEQFPSYRKLNVEKIVRTWREMLAQEKEKDKRTGNKKTKILVLSDITKKLGENAYELRKQSKEKD
jgi:hypothetical protein